MSNMWHNYFDENDVETWSIYKFHKNWNCIHGGDPGRNYCKSADALAKSLRAIVNKSPDSKKIKKANKLLSDLQSWRANENINRLRKKRMNDNNIDTGTNCLQFSSCSDVRIESDTSDRKRKTQSKESVKKRARAETTVDGKVDDGPKTPPRKPLEEKETKDITTPQKPKLCERSSQYLSKHISVNINEQGLIMKGDQDVIIPEIPDEIQRWLINVLSSEKDRFVSTIMASLNPEHKFQKMCRIILYDFFSMTSEGLMDRNIGERKYTVEQIMPLFKAIQSVYREYKFDWIEVQLECIKDMKLLFPNFDLTLNKADGVCMKASNNKEVVFIEVSGGPEATVEKHVWEDTEKLIREAMFGLVSLLRDYLDKNSTGAKNIRTYMVQVIGNAFTTTSSLSNSTNLT
ncbi:15990_t:CDS:2 [Funneliformis geosporum]|uniref:15990_t:CDS:1 n=1 Tax=Funneliformis geosporum TaxID=1117311 RepID=A0A9W4T1J5_9GLOM|nr:15990_t:CDS:2 [Funneliformis geosporum]